jgi:hypothetical protein
LNYTSGELFVNANARSAAAALMARGGVLNAPARDILSQYGLPVLGGYAYSVPLHVAHPATRATSELGGCLDLIWRVHKPRVGGRGRRLEERVSGTPVQLAVRVVLQATVGLWPDDDGQGRSGWLGVDLNYPPRPPLQIIPTVP